MYLALSKAGQSALISVEVLLRAEVESFLNQPHRWLREKEHP
jgi:hypothetical protein